MLNIHGLTRKQAGLPEDVVQSHNKQQKQTSISSFFTTKQKNNFHDAGRNFSSDHNAEGRFQFFAFEEMDLIQTYVPNNGMKEASFHRRKRWDDDMNIFLKSRLQILRACGKENRTLLWCGDLNCARDYRDGTHWEERSYTQKGDGKKSSYFYEWWTDESKCFMSNPEKNRNPEDRGMPSFTPAERQRFSKMIENGNLIDIWRDLHPNGSHIKDSTQFKSCWDHPNWTWRAHLSKNSKNKYEGRGQRLDYFLLSRSSALKPIKCDILGYGSQRKGLFCGSDHCASILVVKR